MRTARADAARLERARDAKPTPGAKLAFVSNMVQDDRGVARALRVAEVPTESEADHGAASFIVEASIVARQRGAGGRVNAFFVARPL